MKTQKQNELQEEIGKRAYRYWEAAGRPSGRDVEFWLNAESEIMAAKQPATLKIVPQKSGPTRSAATNLAPLKPESANIPASRIPAPAERAGAQVRKG